MDDLKNTNGLRAENLAKAFLLNTNQFLIQQDFSNMFDFSIIDKRNRNKIFGVQINSVGTLEKNKVLLPFRIKRNRISHLHTPAIIIYIDLERQEGLFEILNSRRISNRLLPLENLKFKKEVANA